MGQRSEILLVALAALALAGCDNAGPPKPEAGSYFLWAGVPAPAELDQAASVYALAGEVRLAAPGRFVSLRQPPTVSGPQVWFVVRTETLEWSDAVYSRLDAEIARWDRSTNLVGVQVDFDAGTRGLDRYGAFLRDFRQRLPERYRLSITGLMDWSAHGDADALAGLAGVVDEVVIQTYQGRSTIPDYERYLAGLERLPMDYRIGIVEDGQWRAPPELAGDANYRGTVTFLTRP